MRSITIKRVILKSAKIILPVAFWLTLWQIFAMLVNRSLLVPTVPETCFALIEIITSKNFFKIILMTFVRIMSGLLLGIIGGFILALLSHKFEIINILLTPFISVIKSTPVATFIVILWIMLSGNALTILIAFLMVFPIIWQNLMDGYKSIDKDLSEVCDIFEFSFAKRMKILVFPALMKYLIPSIITATGLAWKAEIAAEIIAYTKNSIGQQINDAKSFFETPTVFAWTLLIIVMSISLEKLTKYLLGRFKI